MEGRKEGKKERRRKNNAKFSGHYIHTCTHKVRAHALHSHQKFESVLTNTGQINSRFHLCVIIGQFGFIISSIQHLLSIFLIVSAE